MKTISDMSTKALLLARSDFRGYRGCYDFDGCVKLEDKIFIGSVTDKGGAEVEIHVTEDELMDELKKRPHVPSKKEAKLIRSLKAKTGQSEEWLRAHPKYGQEFFVVTKPNRIEISKKEYVKLLPLTNKSYMSKFKIKTS